MLFIVAYGVSVSMTVEVGLGISVDEACLTDVIKVTWLLLGSDMSSIGSRASDNVTICQTWLHRTLKVLLPNNTVIEDESTYVKMMTVANGIRK